MNGQQYYLATARMIIIISAARVWVLSGGRSSARAAAAAESFRAEQTCAHVWPAASALWATVPTSTTTEAGSLASLAVVASVQLRADLAATKAAGASG